MSSTKETTKDKPYIKSASVSKDPKPNYHFLRDQSEKSTTDHQKGLNFGKMLNGYRGSTFNAGKSNI
jgi:hypothetical protein